MQGKLSTTELQPPYYATAFKLLVLNWELAERTDGQAEFRFHRHVNCLGARLGKSSIQAVYSVCPMDKQVDSFMLNPQVSPAGQ